MRTLNRFPSSAVLFLTGLFGALAVSSASVAAPCADLPPSTLQTYTVRAPAVEETLVDTLDDAPQQGDLISHHTLMLTMSNLVAGFNIRHRFLTQADGSVCDAPSLVRISFGSTRRVAHFVRAAATDPCVRRAMQEHEAGHTRALDDAVDRFIDRQRSDLARGLAALKQTPAPDAATAQARWELGLKALADTMREQLLLELRPVSTAIDAPGALATLENGCGGKIRQLQQGSP